MYSVNLDPIKPDRNETTFDRFMTFLKSEYGEGQLEFFLEAESLMEMTDMSQKMDMAKDVYQRYLVNGGGGGTD